MSEWSTEVTVSIDAATKVYRVSGEDLDRLDVWRIGSTGFPVSVGVLHLAREAETARWDIRDGWPIGRQECEAIRFEVVRAWRARLEQLAEAAEEPPSQEGSEHHERNRT